MIYFFHGSDTAKARAKAFQWVRAARDKAPDAGYIRLNAEELTEEQLNSALAAQGLFFSRTLIVLDDPFENSETAELVLRKLEELGVSPNPVAIVAPKLIAARAKKIEAAATKTFVCDRTAAPKRAFNTKLVDALVARNAQSLWKEIVVAIRQGDAPEMVHGLLHWKARQLMAKGARDWSKDEARALSRTLIELLSLSRKGDAPLGEQLERFALSVSR